MLRVSGLTRVFGEGAAKVIALDDVSMEGEAGELLALVGPSGSGKTTLLAIIGGLLAPTAGRVEVAGNEVSALSGRDLVRYRRDTIGFVFQASNLVPFLSVRENLLLVSDIGAPVRGSSARARAEELLDELGLGERMNALASDLSGGERQRAAIGRALMHDPPVLLVDEPTSNLDSARGRRVVELLADEVRSRGKLGVMVTHDLAMTELADRVITLRDGKVVAATAGSTSPGG